MKMKNTLSTNIKAILSHDVSHWPVIKQIIWVWNIDDVAWPIILGGKRN